MDSGHDGAWLRREPRPDRSDLNVVCLIPNGDQVSGELVYVRLAGTGEEGVLRFCDLEQLGRKAWRVRSSSGAAATPVLSRPLAAAGTAEAVASGGEAASVVCQAAEGTRVEGEFIFVVRKDGKKAGFIKRQYLTALV